MGAWRFAETLQLRHFLGAAIIALSLLVIDGRILPRHAHA